MSNIKDKVAYITGGSKGIGYGIAEALIEQGAKVAITGRTESTLDEAAKALNDKVTGSCMAIVADVRNSDDQFNAVQRVIQKWGQLDISIANAGVGHFDSIENLSTQQWNDVIDINLTGTFHTIKASLEALKLTQGYFMTVASLAGTNFFANGSAYNASKFGVVGFTQAVMLDLRKHGIKVTTIMPGSVSTYFNNRVPSEAESWKIQPEDIGQMVVDLLKMHPRTLPSKVEVRPSMPPTK